MKHDLTDLVHKAFPDLHDSSALVQGERRIMASVAANGGPRKQSSRRLIAVGAFAAAAALALLLGAAHLRKPNATYVVRGATEIHGYVAAGDQTASIAFSDGSEIRLSDGGAARIVSYEPEGAIVVLEQGSAHVRVVHRPSTSWMIRCGAYVVSIRGTEFDISWSHSRESVRIDLYSGSLAVDGGPMGNGFVLVAGQRAILERDGVQVLALRSAEPGAPSPSTAPDADHREVPRPQELAASSATATVESEPPPPEAPPSDKPARSWSESVRAGRYEEVLEQARARGIDSALKRGSARDLQALADAARYRRAGDIARRSYLALRERFPNTEYARQAAWMLGRLSEGSAPAEATAWYERYRIESPHGTYAGEALGRAMLVSERTGQHARARELARSYLREQPDGAFARSAAAILAAP